MGKNKKRNRQQRQDRRHSETEQPQEQTDSPAEQARAQGNPADVARKQQRRFGHN